MTLSSSVPTKLKIYLYLDHQPEAFGVHPELAAILNTNNTDRSSITQALWGYIKLHGLQDEEKKLFKTDQYLKKVSHNFRMTRKLLILVFSYSPVRTRFPFITFLNTFQDFSLQILRFYFNIQFGEWYDR